MRYGSDMREFMRYGSDQPENMVYCSDKARNIKYSSNDPGIYTIILYLDRADKIEVGSLGLIDFSPGYYAYTGSARGPGGCRRIDRHIEVMRKERSTRRWHIDYILPRTEFVCVFVTRTSRDLECRIARKAGEHLKQIKGFGCSDCSCYSHLHYASDLELMSKAVSAAHSEVQPGTDRLA